MGITTPHATPYTCTASCSPVADTPPRPTPLQTTRVIKLVRLLRVVKLLRMVRNSGFFIQLRKVLGTNLMRLTYLSLVAAMVMHWLACAFYYAASMQAEGETTWVILAGLSSASK